MTRDLDDIKTIDQITYMVHRVGVWVGKDNKPRCTEWSGKLVAISMSCKHARALKRYLAKTGTVCPNANPQAIKKARRK